MNMSGYVALYRRFQKLQVMGGIFNYHFNVPIATFHTLSWIAEYWYSAQTSNSTPSGCPRPKWCILSGG